MTGDYEEDLDMYEEARGPQVRQLDNEVAAAPHQRSRLPNESGLCRADTQVSEALETMADMNIGALLVVDGGKIVGIFAERDALRKKLYRGGLDRPVRDYMTPEPECLTPDDSIAFALNRMAIGGYRHIPLVSPELEPVGILVMRDVVGYLVSFFPAEVVNVPPHSEYNPARPSPRRRLKRWLGGQRPAGFGKPVEPPFRWVKIRRNAVPRISPQSQTLRSRPRTKASGTAEAFPLVPSFSEYFRSPCVQSCVQSGLAIPG